MSTSSLDLPQADGGDVLHTAVTTILSTIPFVGAGELFKFMVTPSLEKRRERWMQLVAEAIQELQRRQFNIAGLQDNEEFITLLLQCTQAAFKTHLASKHLLLKTALVNATLASSTFDTKQLYLTLLDRLTESHFAILVLVEQHKRLTIRMKSADQFYEKLLELNEITSQTIEWAPFLAFLGDLEQAGLLVKSDDFKVMDADVEQSQVMLLESHGESGLPRMDVTDFARQFLAFIRE